jgi:hypothetical protein
LLKTLPRCRYPFAGICRVRRSRLEAFLQSITNPVKVLLRLRPFVSLPQALPGDIEPCSKLFYFKEKLLPCLTASIHCVAI